MKEILVGTCLWPKVLPPPPRETSKVSLFCSIAASLNSLENILQSFQLTVSDKIYLKQEVLTQIMAIYLIRR